jgi:hypothetical protein
LKLLALLLLTTTAIAGETAGIFNEVVELPDGRVAVVAEAAREPRSIGSYSVRLYGARNPDFPFDDFVAGTIQSRDGTLDTLSLEDIDGDTNIDLVVIIVSAGSGGYLSGDAFAFSEESIARIGHVDGLDPTDNVIEALRNSRSKTSSMKLVSSPLAGEHVASQLRRRLIGTLKAFMEHARPRWRAGVLLRDHGVAGFETLKAPTRLAPRR